MVRSFILALTALLWLSVFAGSSSAQTHYVVQMSEHSETKDQLSGAPKHYTVQLNEHSETTDRLTVSAKHYDVQISEVKGQSGGPKHYEVQITENAQTKDQMAKAPNSHEAQMIENFKTTGQVQRQITYGVESWQFFAFIFAVVYTFGVNLGSTLGGVGFLSRFNKSTLFKLALHVMWLVVSGYLIMKYLPVHNLLLRFLGYIKQAS